MTLSRTVVDRPGSTYFRKNHNAARSALHSRIVRWALLLITGCGRVAFDPVVVASDASDASDATAVDAVADTRSCATILATNLATVDGIYTIDPDGPGG